MSLSRKWPESRARDWKLRRFASAAPTPTKIINSGIRGAVPSSMMPAAQLTGNTATMITTGMKTATAIWGR
ncbi:hypothetical protein D3C85_1722290 [compost metagenome]